MADTLLYDAQFHHFAQVGTFLSPGCWEIMRAPLIRIATTLSGCLLCLIRSRAALLSSLPDPILPQIVHHLQLLAATAVTSHMYFH